jgi:choline dehydrogenase-like flavoprotein
MNSLLIIGSGAGGATVARDVAKNGVDVTVIEKGPIVSPKMAYKCYDSLDIGLELLKTSCVGGSTLVAAGNGVRTLEGTLKKLGINLEEEFREVERELNVKTLPDSHFGRGTNLITDSASFLGFNVEKMPKFIDPILCEPCGKCTFGCSKNAKWSALKFVEEAKRYGAKIIENTPITDIITEKGAVCGVKSYDKIFSADKVVLAPGAVETPVLLRRIGINAGNNLFVDTFVTIGGILKDIEFNQDVQMNALIKFDEFILAPHFSDILVQNLQKYGAEKKDILGMMIKIKDQPSGKIRENKIYKNNTSKDLGLIGTGSAIAGSILVQSGVDPTKIVSTNARGAHPGGTAAIGTIVNKNLETEIKGLFVADASVFPESPGAPPILTIIALAKRLSKYLVE